MSLTETKGLFVCIFLDNIIALPDIWEEKTKPSLDTHNYAITRITANEAVIRSITGFGLSQICFVFWIALVHFAIPHVLWVWNKRLIDIDVRREDPMCQMSNVSNLHPALGKMQVSQVLVTLESNNQEKRNLYPQYSNVQRSIIPNVKLVATVQKGIKCYVDKESHVR